MPASRCLGKRLDPKLVYWSAALVNMAVIVTCALTGVRRARRRNYLGHKRMVVTAAWLVLAFLVSYLVKLPTLGREQLELWQPFYVHTLRIHEVCVALMVIAGATALIQARRLGLPVPPGEAQRLARGIRLHRRAGWTAVISSIAGFLTASVVLFGMYARAG